MTFEDQFASESNSVDDFMDALEEIDRPTIINKN